MHESQTAEALRMLDVFASVGVRRFDIEHIDLDQQHRGSISKERLSTLSSGQRMPEEFKQSPTYTR